MLGAAAGCACEPLIFAARALASDSTEAAVDCAADGVELTAGGGAVAVLDPDVRTSVPLGLCTDAAAWGGALLLAVPFVLQATSTFRDALSSKAPFPQKKVYCILQAVSTCTSAFA